MKKRLFKFIMLFAVLASIFTLVSCLKSDKADFTKIKVVLLKTDGVEIISKQVMEIKPGNDVTFNVKIADEYAYLGMTKNGVAVREEEGVPAKDFPIEGEYNEKTGQIKLKAVKYPTTIEIIAKPKGDLYSFDLAYNNRQGGAQVIGGTKLTVGYKWLPRTDEKVKVVAYANENYNFNGWSIGGYIEDGGTIVSYDKEFEYTVTDNTVLYANFSEFGSNNYKVVYHGNGGKVALEGKDKGKESYEVLGEYNSQFPMQQVLWSNDTFKRDGYVAIGYSTQKVLFESYETVNDIPGFTNMGGVSDIPISNVLALYVIWAKETPASDFTFSSGKITKYNGNSAIVVIPETIGGVKVTEISAGAFKDNKKITRLVIPKSVTSIKSGAFENCTGISDVVFFDSVTDVSDESFKGCTGIKTVTLNSQRLPRYSGTAEGTFCVKYERLRTLTGKKIIVVSGASTLHAINSKTLELNLKDYSALNYGTNENTSTLFYLDVISKYIGKGDIVIHAPELNYASTQGDNTITPKLFRANEQCYDIFRDVDMRDYKGFWTAFGKYQVGDPDDPSLKPAVSQTGKDYQLNCADLNEYGDWNQERTEPTVESFGSANATFDTTKLNYTNLNAVNTKITKVGATLLMSFAARDVLMLKPEIAINTKYDEFTRYCDNMLEYPVISNVGNYMIDHMYFWDSQYHCNDDGSTKITKQLITDIKRYLDNTSSGPQLLSSQLSIIYHANGGKVTSTGETLYEVSIEPSEQFPMQQTVWSNGTFVRDGYIAIGYSTAQVNFDGNFETVNDIPGFSNLGGVCEVPTDTKTLRLYVVWARETASTDFEFANGVIKKYKGSAEIVVVPEYIGGVEVTQIAKDAFKGNASLKRLVLPKTLTTLDDHAFLNCTSLKEVVFFDSLLYATDNAFYGSDNITTITLNSQRLPRYGGSAEGTFCIKYEMVRVYRNQKKIVVLSGSSTMHALDSAFMEESYPGYKVVNYGTNISGCGLMYLDAISNYITEGDIIIHAPEATGGSMLGDNAITPKTFRGNEQCYDIFREVDMTKYDNFWTAFSYFQVGDPRDGSLTPAINLGGQPYQRYCSQLNKYGDIIHRGSNPNYQSSQGNGTFNYSVLTSQRAANLNRVGKRIVAGGGHYLVSFAARDKNRIGTASQTAVEYNKFTTHYENEIDFPVISNVGDYLLDAKYFWDSEWHTNDAGKKIRTEQLITDINKYLTYLKNGGKPENYRAPQR